MRLIPLTVEAAIAGLVRTATTTLGTAAPELEKTDDGPAIVARAKFEVQCVSITLGQLQQLPIDNLSAIPLHQRAQVQLVHLVALLGEGVSALDSLGYILDDSYHTEADDADAGKRPDELIDAVWRLQDFRTSTWLLLNVLQSPSGTAVPGSSDSLRTAVSCLLNGGTEGARRLRCSDAYTSHLRNSVQLGRTSGANITLADTDSVARATIPVCAGDLLDASPYVFGNPP